MLLFTALQATESDDQQRLRFQVELEFVQCLANPNYLHCKFRYLQIIPEISFLDIPSVLAQRDYFKDPAFVNYLKYLLYWKKPEFAKFLKYPMCLYFLDLLQSEEFRRKIVTAPCCKFIDDQAILLWQHYTRRRTKTLEQQHFLHNPPRNPPNAQQNQNGTSQKMS